MQSVTVMMVNRVRCLPGDVTSAMSAVSEWMVNMRLDRQRESGSADVVAAVKSNQEAEFD